MGSQLFRVKDIDRLIADSESSERSLKKTLGWVSLTSLGIGAVIGSGIFTVIGTAIAGVKLQFASVFNAPLLEYLIHHSASFGRPGAGPAIALSFVLVAVALALPPEDKLVRMIRTQIGTILDDAHDFVPVLHYEWRSLTPANRRRILALKDRYDALWQGLIDELQRTGHMPGDAQLMRLLILGAVNWVGTWYNEDGRLSLDDVAQGAARLFLRDMPQ